jgi:vacuolar-type H+-ATPase catalytic subunit A/Vma1
MGKAMGKAQAEMSESISAMQGRNGALAFQKQNGAMKALNEAAALTQGAMNQMMQGGQGSGMMSMMQQLQQMSQQQMGLNQLTKMMQQGGMSQEQMAQMQRLAQEQQLIQKSLEQLNKESRESGQSKKLTSNLEKILEEMQEVITGMKTQKIDDDLIQAQERILSKLLDAQRSINERDFEKKRESTAGTNFNLDSPPELLFLLKKEEKNCAMNC